MILLISFRAFSLQFIFDVYATFVDFHALASYQLQLTIWSVQCDNGQKIVTLNLTSSLVIPTFFSLLNDPIHLNKMVRPSDLFVQQTASFVLYCFNHLPYHAFGPKLYTLRTM
jgi:hypothetical protein